MHPHDQETQLYPMHFLHVFYKKYTNAFREEEITYNILIFLILVTDTILVRESKIFFPAKIWRLSQFVCVIKFTTFILS